MSQLRAKKGPDYKDLNESSTSVFNEKLKNFDNFKKQLVTLLDISSTITKAIESWTGSMMKISRDIQTLCDLEDAGEQGAGVSGLGTGSGFDAFAKTVENLKKAFSDISTNLHRSTIQIVKNDISNGVHFLLENVFTKLHRRSEDRVASQQLYEDHQHQLVTYGRQQEDDKKAIISKLLEQDQEKLSRIDSELFSRFDKLEKDHYRFLTTSIATLLSCSSCFHRKSDSLLSTTVQSYGAYDHISSSIDELKARCLDDLPIEANGAQPSSHLLGSFPYLFEEPTVAFPDSADANATFVEKPHSFNPSLVDSASASTAEDADEEDRELERAMATRRLPWEAVRPLETKTVLVKSDYSAADDDELTLRTGEYITVLETDDSGWWKGKCNGKIGYFPDCYTEPA